MRLPQFVQKDTGLLEAKKMHVKKEGRQILDTILLYETKRNQMKIQRKTMLFRNSLSFSMLSCFFYVPMGSKG